LKFRFSAAIVSYSAATGLLLVVTVPGRLGPSDHSDRDSAGTVSGSPPGPGRDRHENMTGAEDLVVTADWI
jgi:hypothetical protein